MVKAIQNCLKISTENPFSSLRVLPAPEETIYHFILRSNEINVAASSFTQRNICLLRNLLFVKKNVPVAKIALKPDRSNKSILT